MSKKAYCVFLATFSILISVYRQREILSRIGFQDFVIFKRKLSEIVHSSFSTLFSGDLLTADLFYRNKKYAYFGIVS